MNSATDMRITSPLTVPRQILLCIVLMLACVGSTFAQSANTDLDGRRVQSVTVAFTPADAVPDLYRDAVLRAFATFPNSRFDPMRANLLLNKVRRLNFVASAAYRVEIAGNGDVLLVLDVGLSETAGKLAQSPIGLFADGTLADFPTLYADDRNVLGAKIENKTMLFSNTNAFFGRPDVLTAGNPLAENPSGKGTDTWLESSLQVGIYGLSSLNDRVSAFVGASYIYSGSWGPELFTDATRTYGGVEDAYVGLIGNNTTASGGSRQIALLYGRKSFQVDSGMILRLSSANGGERAALQSNPRNAADMLMLAQFSYDAHKLELFRLDADELEELDTGTVIDGINYEGHVLPNLRLGAMLLQVPESRFAYYTETDVYSREGLRVADVRLSLEPPAGKPGLYAKGEFARQTHRDFDMDARAGYAEIGYQFSAHSWRPTPSYRYSRFTGDDPDTDTFERWDPLFAGGGGDEWVQGLNQYKVVQTSNVIAHRFMARLQPSTRWELVPQFWIFKADDLNNLGGAQALSVLSSKDLGHEVNLTARYLSSAKLIYVFSAAYTLPGEAIRNSLNDDYRNWFSASALVIARF
jgi:Alginate export